MSEATITVQPEGDVRPLGEVLRARVEDLHDCSADESAAIKAYFDFHDMDEEGSLAARLADAFPCEADEWHEDVEDGERALGKGWLR